MVAVVHVRNMNRRHQAYACNAGTCMHHFNNCDSATTAAGLSEVTMAHIHAGNASTNGNPVIILLPLDGTMPVGVLLTSAHYTAVLVQTPLPQLCLAGGVPTPTTTAQASALDRSALPWPQ